MAPRESQADTKNREYVETTRHSCKHNMRQYDIEGDYDSARAN